ncbi:MAG: LuxR C-terminal-related transcriptional regulator [Ilumatobacteraceae bacterium]
MQRDAWPLIGREEIVATVLRHLADPACDGVFLVGQPGVGTTRVLDAVLAHQQAAQRLANRVVGSQATQGVRFGALAHAIPGELSSGGAPLDPLELFERLRFLIGMPRTPAHRFLCGTDDIRWLDDASLGLLTQLLAGKLATVVATVHDDAVLPDAVVTIERSCAIRRVVVPPLDHETTTQLIDLALDGPVDGTTAHDLTEQCQGNPLFLAEILDGSIATGALTTVLGTWTLTGTPVVTARLSRLLDASLQRLDDDGRDLVELLAFAEPVALDALEAAGLLKVALTLEAAGFLATDPADPAKVRLAQPLAAGQVRTRTSPLRRRMLLPRAIELVAGDGQETVSDDDIVRLSLWRLECGHEVTVPDLERAAAATRARNDFETTEELTSAAAELQPSLGTLLLQAEALHDLCRFDQADQVMTRAESLVNDDFSALRLAIVRHRALLWGRHDGEGSVRVLRAVIEELQEPAMRDFARIAIANTVVFSGNPGAVDGLAASIEVEGDLEKTGFCFPRTVAAFLQGRHRAAIEIGAEGMERRAAFGGQAPMGHPSLYGLAHGMALIEHGSFAQAEQVLAEAYTNAVEQHIPQLHVWLALARGRNSLAQGRLGDARRWFMEARSVADQARFSMGLRIALSGVLACAGQLRDLDQARLAARAMAELPDDHGLMWPLRHLGHAWHATADGRASDALGEVLAGAVEAEARGEYSLQAELLFEGARMGHAAAIRTAFDAAVAGCDGPLVEARVQFVRGLADGDAIGLASAERQLAALGAWVAAAEAAAELARLLHRAGRPRDAQGATNRSAQYRHDLVAVTTPLLVDLSGGDELSPRERQIAVLAAAGHPSKLIARDLGLSVRTVSNHLQNAYLKLGISGRDDLATALAAQPE